jgi:uncharacterized protein YbjT (DUF2867 family)
VRVLILGASGFIGSAAAARLQILRFEVVGVSRSPANPLVSRHFRLDISRAIDPADWQEALQGVQAVVNCAGTLQDSLHDSTEGVHAIGLAALLDACEQFGVKRFLHISAAGVDRDTPTNFSRSKLKGDRDVASRDLDWIIFRPSVVIGRAAYGGSALIRGLAALPGRPSFPNAGSLQFIHLDDLLDAIVFFLKEDAPARKILEIAGPRRWSLDASIELFRRWLRWPPAKLFSVPNWLPAPLYWMGDLARILGWRSPINSTAQREILRGAIGDAARWSNVTGIEPRDIEDELMKEPASVQERWFSRLYLLKPIIFAVFGLFWIVTGAVSLGPGWNYGMDLLREGSVPEHFAALTIISGAFADIVIGFAILYRPTSRYGLLGAVSISLIYVVVGTTLVPRLWSDPLGPMLKIWPVIVLNLVALAILEDR